MRRRRKKVDSLEQAIVLIVAVVVIFAVSVFMPKENETARGVTTRQELSFSMDEIPEFDESTPYVVINENIPEFEEKDFTTKSFEQYSELDELGRCRSCFCKCWN